VKNEKITTTAFETNIKTRKKAGQQGD